ncbi:MAG: hypothetical protein A2161_01555 [Candidatus Schekmanbacteria bacterium RBG_13_48_7]|uniref:Uncharacterized protein n=1 Tax=Candidatus Schekmanbacteria bacterium RBG_13_48_7 TaxID=1817878 RepID=A0A1F7RUP4_9BACT|nr:MAG: hypothetical protein A2161_01555 [Candidatus Schekmanbacteria bacterium RBG_13_48_7]
MRISWYRGFRFAQSPVNRSDLHFKKILKLEDQPVHVRDFSTRSLQILRYFCSGHPGLMEEIE